MARRSFRGRNESDSRRGTRPERDMTRGRSRGRSRREVDEEEEEEEEEAPARSPRGRGGKRPSPTARRVPSRSEESAPARSSSSKRSGKKRPSGWDAVEERKKENEARKEANENRLNDFYLTDGEFSFIQFLHDEPLAVLGHRIKTKGGRYDFQTCQKESQKHCLMCEDGLREMWMAAFKILDYRGSWDNKNKEFKWDDPVEKKFLMGVSLAEQFRNFKDKKGMELTEMVIDISRSGEGKSTSYNLELAMEDGDIVEPYDWDEDKATIEEAMMPLTDDELTAIGFSEPDYN